MFSAYSGSVLIHILRNYSIAEYVLKLLPDSVSDPLDALYVSLHRMKAFCRGEVKVEPKMVKSVLEGDDELAMLERIFKLWTSLTNKCAHARRHGVHELSMFCECASGVRRLVGKTFI